MTWRRPSPIQVRDNLLRLVGAVVFLNEAFVESGERPTLLLGSLALMGLPFFFPNAPPSAQPSPKAPDPPPASPAEPKAGPP